MAAVVRRLPCYFSSTTFKHPEWKLAFAIDNKKKRTYFTYTPEIAQPLQREPKWVCADEAVKCIGSGKLYLTKYLYKIYLINLT